MTPPLPVEVIKRDHAGQSLFSYTGMVVARGDTWVCLEAHFARDDIDAGYIVFRRGDLFTEWFYSDRWYNVFKIQDVHDGGLKGWYCNITRPAIIEQGESGMTVSADDLALDVFVSPTGDVTVLDEDEFAALDLTPEEHTAALDAVEAIRRAAALSEGPFCVT